MKKRRGFSLIEVSIVLAITGLMVVGVLSFSRNSDRRNFDNGMQNLLAQLREIQGEANSGIGPDPRLFNCARFSGGTQNPNSTVDPNGIYGQIGNLANCPYAPYKNPADGKYYPTYMFGRSVSFAHGSYDSHYYDVTDSGQSLDEYYVGSTLSFQPLLQKNIIDISSVSNINEDYHLTPNDVGFYGYCLQYNTPDTTCDTAHMHTDGVVAVFARAGLDATTAAKLPDGALPATKPLTRIFPTCAGFDDHTFNCTTPVVPISSCNSIQINPEYFEFYTNSLCTSTPLVSQQVLTLRFTDMKTAKYKSEIIINPNDNTINLLTQ